MNNNEELQKALNVYFDNLNIAIKEFKEGNHLYRTKPYYINGINKAVEILQKVYENKYSAIRAYAKGWNVTVSPKIYLKAKTEGYSAKNGIYIYLELSNNEHDRYLYLSLEMGKGRYEKDYDLYPKNITKLQHKYQSHLEDITHNLEHTEIIKSNESIFKIKVTDFNKLISYINLLIPTYDDILKDIQSYNLETKTWNNNWEQYQQDLFKESYVPNLPDNSLDNDEDIIEDEKNTLENISFNRIYYGIPGCGKSNYIQRNYQLNDDNTTRITFYPDYTISDFIGQVIPRTDKNDDTIIRYKFEPGPFTIALKKALQSNKSYYLVIEEINRGNASAIFGDIFQILDRNQDGESCYPIDNYAITNYLSDELHQEITKVSLPSNLNIIATMNTNDQNVYSLDTAFKRRWEMYLIKNKFDDELDYDNKIRKMLVPGTDITWEEFVIDINKAILSRNQNRLNSEDKQIGKYFVSERDLVDPQDDLNKINFKKNRFSEKVLMYIWEDVAKMNKNEWFDEYNSYEELLEDFYLNSEKVINNMLNGFRNE